MIRRFIRALTLAFALCTALCVSNASAQDKLLQPDYSLGAGDSIRVLVFQNPDLTIDTRVSENGSITYPLIGAVELGGLSIAAAETKIANALKDGGFVQQPQVNIVLMQVRGNQVSVLPIISRSMVKQPNGTTNSRLTANQQTFFIQLLMMTGTFIWLSTLKTLLP